MAKHDSDCYMSEVDWKLYHRRAAIVCALVGGLGEAGLDVRLYHIQRGVFALQQEHGVVMRYPFTVVEGEPRSRELKGNISSFVGAKFLTYELPEYELPEQYGLIYHADGSRLHLLEAEYGEFAGKHQGAIDDVADAIIDKIDDRS